MKNTLYTLFLLLSVVQVLKAQPDSSHLLVTTNISPSIFSFNNQGLKIREGNFALSSGIKILKNFYTGLGYDLYYYEWRRAGSKSFEGKQRENNYWVFMRYYISLTKKAYLYTQIRGGKGYGTYKPDIKTDFFSINSNTFGATLGGVYFLNNRFSLDASLSYLNQNVKYEQSANYDVKENRKIYALNMGVSFFLLRNNK